jgi:hypothetical protein
MAAGTVGTYTIQYEYDESTPGTDDDHKGPGTTIALESLSSATQTPLICSWTTGRKPKTF